MHQTQIEPTDYGENLSEPHKIWAGSKKMGEQTFSKAPELLNIRVEVFVAYHIQHNFSLP